MFVCNVMFVLQGWLMRLQHVHMIVKWIDDFEKVKVLGVGGTGIVYELMHKTNGIRYAMKEMEIKNNAQMGMALQVMIMILILILYYLIICS